MKYMLRGTEEVTCDVQGRLMYGWLVTDAEGKITFVNLKHEERHISPDDLDKILVEDVWYMITYWEIAGDDLELTLEPLVP